MINIKSEKLRQVLKNSSWLCGDKIFRMGGGLLVGVWVARYLGVEQFGMLNYALAFVGLFGAFSSMGIDSLIVRNLAGEDDLEHCRKELGTAFFIKLLGAVLAVLLAIGSAYFFLAQKYLFFQLVIISSLMMLFQPFDTIDFWWQSKLQSKYTVLAKNKAYIINSFFKIALILSQASLLWFAWAQNIEAFFGALLMLYYYFRQGKSILKWKIDWQRLVNLLKESWPLVLSSIAISIYMRIDQIMLGAMLGDDAVGIYSAAIRISEIWYFIPVSFVASVAPLVTDIYKNKTESDYLERLQKIFNLLAKVSFGIALLMMLLSHLVVQILFGTHFLGAVAVLKIHIWTAIFVFSGIATGLWTINKNLTKISFYVTVTGALVNIFLNLWLIPLLGVVGSALATLIAQFFSSYLMYFIFAKTRGLFFIQSKALVYIFALKSYKKLF